MFYNISDPKDTAKIGKPDGAAFRTKGEMMTISLDRDYRASADSRLLGFIGETGSRVISLSGYQCEGADSYSLIVDYGDGVSYELDMTGGSHTVEGSLLRREGSVLCQVLAKAVSGETYSLVRKSNVFELYILKSLGEDTIPIPTYEEAIGVLDEIKKYAGKGVAAVGLPLGILGGVTDTVIGNIEEVTE